MNEYLLCLFMAGFGFAVAGLLTSVYKMITKTPAKLKIYGKNYFTSFIMLFFTFFAGPVIMVSSVMNARKNEDQRCPYVLTFAAFTASAWSLFIGLVGMAFFVNLFMV